MSAGRPEEAPDAWVRSYTAPPASPRRGAAPRQRTGSASFKRASLVLTVAAALAAVALRPRPTALRPEPVEPGPEAVPPSAPPARPVDTTDLVKPMRLEGPEPAPRPDEPAPAPRPGGLSFDLEGVRSGQKLEAPLPYPAVDKDGRPARLDPPPLEWTRIASVLTTRPGSYSQLLKHHGPEPYSPATLIQAQTLGRGTQFLTPESYFGLWYRDVTAPLRRLPDIVVDGRPAMEFVSEGTLCHHENGEKVSMRTDVVVVPDGVRFFVIEHRAPSEFAARTAGEFRDYLAKLKLPR